MLQSLMLVINQNESYGLIHLHLCGLCL